MQRKTAIFFIIFPLMLISSCVNAKNKTKGEVLYTNLCASCHGKSGIGNGPVASQLKTKPKDLTKLKQKMGDAFDTKVIKDRIDGRTMPRAHGIPEMPVWGEWFSIQSMSKGRLQDDHEGIKKDTEKNLEALAEYILTLQK
ncbi:MAG: c-type cytochrome [Rhodomicrobiaceae bacterium]